MAGSGTALKALRAVLAQKDVKFELCARGARYPFNSWRYDIRRDPEGYQSHSHPLGFGTYHMVLVTKRDGFLPCVSPEALWREISGPKHTTPVRREWMDWLHERLRHNYRALRDTHCWGCNPGLLDLSEETLDRLVSEGVRSGELKL